MKRLWVFLCIIVATVSVFGGFSVPQKAYAQTNPKPENTGQVTIDQALIKAGLTPMTRAELLLAGNKIFNDLITDITALQVRNPQGSSYVVERGKALAKFSDNQFLIYVEKNILLVEALDGAQKVFEANLATPPTPSTIVYGDYKAAFQFAYDYMYSGGIQRKFTGGGIVPDFNHATRIVILREKDRIPDTLNYETFGGGATVNAAAYTQVRAGSVVAKIDTCSLGFKPNESFSIGACINDAVVWIIKNTLLQIATFLVWLTANIFNYAVQIGILQFSKWAPDTLYPIWIIVRQIISLLIVFVGLYLGFMYILGKEDKFEKYIPWVVIFALFVNFSYPIARTAIDVSNIISLNIYASAVGNDALTNTDIFSQNTAGAVIMNKLGLQGLTASALSTPQGDGFISNINSIPGSLLAVVFVLYAAYIFFMVAGIIVMRTAILVFLTIASPILLVDSVLPVLGDQAKKLRKMFFEQLAVGPVFMIMLALTMKFLEVFSSPNGPIGAVSINSSSSGADSIKTFFGILMMLIMLHIMIKVTKSISGTAGEYATNFMGKVGGFGLGVATGGAGLLARQSIGRVASKLQNHEWVRNNQDTIKGRLANRITGSIATSTFDLRNSSVVANSANKFPAGKALLGGMGTGQQGGYGGAIKRRDERREAYDKNAREGMQIRYKKDTPDEDGTFHKKGEIDTKATDVAKSRFNENRSNSIFMTKEQKLKVRDEEAVKRTEIKMKEYAKIPGDKKNEELKKLKDKLEEMKKVDKELDSVDAIVLQKTIASIEASNKSRAEAGTIFSDTLSDYKKFDDSPAGKTKKQEFFEKQTDEIKEYLQSKDREIAEVENKKIVKETTDKKYREDMLQAQKDLATAQKETVEVLKTAQAAPESATSTPAVAQAPEGATAATYAIPTSYNVTNPQSIETINFSDFAKAKRLKNTDTTSLDQAGLVPKEGERATEPA